MLNDLPFDLFILLLRVVFIFLLYFFLYQVVRVVSRELQAPPPPPPPPRPSEPRPASLTLIDAGPSNLIVGSVYPLQPITTIGRIDDNVLPLADSFLSSHHARLFQTSGRWFLTDLGSTNGTFINGQRAGREAVPLKDGDVIQLGRIKLRLTL